MYPHDLNQASSHLYLGQYLSKEARYKLVQLCIRHTIGIKMDKPLSKKRGRPITPESILATALDVSSRTVRRWNSHPNAIQSSDVNAEKLAETAYMYNPMRTTEILFEDVAFHCQIVDEWLKRRGIK